MKTKTTLLQLIAEELRISLEDARKLTKQQMAGALLSSANKMLGINEKSAAETGLKR